MKGRKMMSGLKGFKIGLACIAGVGMLSFGASKVEAAKECQHYHFVEVDKTLETISCNEYQHTILVEHQHVCANCNEVIVVGTSVETGKHEYDFELKDGGLYGKCLYCDFDFFSYGAR